MRLTTAPATLSYLAFLQALAIFDRWPHNSLSPARQACSVPTLSLCIRSDLPLVTSFYAFTYALTPLPYGNNVLCTMWFCLHVLHLLYVVPLVSGKDHVPLGYI